jgi:hypothetical protein
VAVRLAVSLVTVAVVQAKVLRLLSLEQRTLAVVAVAVKTALLELVPPVARV